MIESRSSGFRNLKIHFALRFLACCHFFFFSQFPHLQTGNHVKCYKENKRGNGCKPDRGEESKLDQQKASEPGRSHSIEAAQLEPRGSALVAAAESARFFTERGL